MFTKAPGLIPSIETLIDQTPFVDPHTHIHCDSPSAADLATLLDYHWVQSELVAVGAPVSRPNASSEERVRNALPYLGKIRNTAISWCLTRIFADLYEFKDDWINESNYEDLCERVLVKSKTPSWPRQVLRDRCQSHHFVTSLGNRGQETSTISRYASFMLDLHYLVCPGVATDLDPFFTGRTRKDEYFEALCAAINAEPGTPSELDRAVRAWLDRVMQGRVRFSNTYIPIDQRFAEPDQIETQNALNSCSKSKSKQNKSEHVDAMVRAVIWAILGWHHDHAKALQIAVGAEYFICDGKSIPRFQETWTSEMCRVFHRFDRVRFDLMMASDVLAHEIVILARQFPNIYVSGYWWHNFFPWQIEQLFGLRVQAAPASKIGGFLSDAYSVEWAYAKRALVKKAVATALARLVESGFTREELLPDLLHQVFYETPRQLYDLEITVDPDDSRSA